MKKTLFLFLLALSSLATAQNTIFKPGELDVFFTAGPLPNTANMEIKDVLVLPDKNILVAGNFTAFNGVARSRIARISPAGVLDATFNPPVINGFVDELMLQSDGKILIRGSFTTVGGVARTQVARLNADGTLDVDFVPAIVANTMVTAFTLTTDGKILVGTRLYADFEWKNGLVRLTSTGTLDATFTNTVAYNSSINSIKLLTSGKIVVGGEFTTVAGTARNRTAQLNANGTHDTAFNPGTGFNQSVTKVHIQADGKIVAVGSFSQINGQTRYRIARLNANGSFDATFDAGVVSSDIRDVLADSDGKLLIGGAFQTIAGSDRTFLARLDANGALDAGFSITTNNFVNTVALQADGKILFAGNFTEVNSIATYNIARVFGKETQLVGPPQLVSPATNAVVENAAVFSWNAASLATSYDLQVSAPSEFNSPADFTTPTINKTGLTGTTYSATESLSNLKDYYWRMRSIDAEGNPSLWSDTQKFTFVIPAQGVIDLSLKTGTGFNNAVFAIAPLPDKKVVVGGAFTQLNNVSHNRLVKLLEDGSVDPAFSIGTGFGDYVVQAVVVQPDGKILVGGDFTTFNGSTVGRIVRLNENGSLDSEFQSGTGFNSYIQSMAIQPDGKILVAGNFTSYNGTARNRIIRLNTNGTIDETFTIGTGFDANVVSIALQENGKIIAGGQFNAFNGTAVSRVARLNADGSFDASFTPGFTPNSVVYKVAVQFDGKILVGGAFTFLRNRLARLNADGSLDTSFLITTGIGGGTNTRVDAILPQQNGKILIGGNLISYNGTMVNRTFRLKRDGTIDDTFVANPGPNGLVYALDLQEDGKILIGGDFQAAENRGQRFMRLIGEPIQSLIPVPQQILPELNAANTALKPEFTWTSVNGALRYEFKIAKNQDLTSPVLEISDLTETRFVPSNFFAANTDYFWSVRVVVAAGTSDWAFPSKFKTKPLNPSIRVSPDSAASNIPHKPTFVWRKVEGAALYELQASKNTDFSSPTIFQENLTDTTFSNPTNLENFMAYFWRIRAKDVDGNPGAWTTSWPFTTDYLGDFKPGEVDLTYNFSGGPNNTVRTAVVLEDGKVMIGGEFTEVSSISRNRIARLNANGSLDATFSIGTGFNEMVSTIVRLADGKWLVAGSFTQFNGVTRRRIARLNSDGALDTSFDPGTGPSAGNMGGAGLVLLPLPDGKILIGGNFSSYSGNAANSIARINADGTFDNSFNSGTGIRGAIGEGSVGHLILQPDGKILVGGLFNFYNTTAQNTLVRIHPDGTLDETLKSPSLIPTAMALLPDGKILFAHTGLHKLMRLNADGSTDLPFSATTDGFTRDWFNGGFINALHVKRDGKIVIGGTFTSVVANGNLTGRNRVARLQENGPLDLTFVPGTGFNNTINVIKPLPDGKLFAGGMFTTVNNASRVRTTRLFNDDIPVALRAPVLFSPAHQAQIPQTDILLSWTPEIVATAYGIQVATDEAFTDIIKNANAMKTESSFLATGLTLGQTYYWRVTASAGSESAGWSTIRSFTVVTPTSSEKHALATFELGQNYPNPFNPTTRIRYSIDKSGPVLLQVMDITGRVIATLVNGVQPAGARDVQFDARSLSNGIYLYRLQAGSNIQVRKMTLMK